MTWKNTYARSALTSAHTSLSTISPHFLRWTHFCMPSQEFMPPSLFLYLIQSCHYIPSFFHQLLPLYVPCLTSHQKVLHILHLSTVTFYTLPPLPLQTSPFPHLHLQLCCTPPPPLISWGGRGGASPTPLPTTWPLPPMHTSPLHLTCLPSAKITISSVNRYKN